ncbi:Membrane protein involved in the export of O-antigen and teichoic acid [Peptostreptococcaceae bacterium pGA-8]|nr:Membrane protein involved in the export of O-antigen and teichoic acid [Peptostreptococcaceae bacterium pGA-8]
MRLENSARNIKTAWMLQLVHILCQFFSRTAIIYTLSIEYVGLSGLFSNILTMLSLAELGIGEAIIFSLYGPIARGEIDTIQAIMSFYKKVYISIGIFVLCVGLSITPFIDNFIKEKPAIEEIYVIYMLYVVNTAVSYFFSYKAAFITANQKNSTVVINNGIFEVLMVICQVISLAVWKNYLLFMIIGITFALAQNISINIIANKKYSYLCEKVAIRIPNDILSQIKKNTGAMVFHKIGTIVVFATDNLIISKFIGLVTVGIYANYFTITGAVTTFISKFFNSIAASIGNLAVEEGTEVQEKVFFRVLFVNFALYNVACCCLFNLLNPFIKNIWLNERYVFSTFVVLLLILKVFIVGMRGSAQTFKNAKGLYWYNRYMPIYESLINLVASLILVKYMGISGVILGTIISSIFTFVWIEPYVLYKYGFNKKANKYFKKYGMYYLIFAICMLASFSINKMILIGGLIGFLIMILISTTVPIIIMWLSLKDTDEFRYFKNVITRKVVRK